MTDDTAMQQDSGLFYRNPRVTALMIAVVVLTGLSAFSSLPRQEDPTMTERWASVKTYVPGATAERIESQVSEPIEAKLREVPEIDTIDSISRAGFSSVQIALYDSTTADEVETIWSEVRDKLGETVADLPSGATAPELTMNKPLASTFVVELAWRGSTEPEFSLLSRLARALEIRLANLGGTEETEIFGEIEEEVLISLDPYAAARAGVSPGAVAERIRGADTKDASGRLRANQTDLLVEVDAELTSAERIAGIPLASADGSFLRISDVATVRKRALDPPATMAFHGTERVVMVSAIMQPGLTVGEWTALARRATETFAESLPDDIEATVIFEQNVYTSQRMSDLAGNLVFALIIVLLVLMWFMGLRAAITVGIALPLSGAMVLVGMQFMDIPMHQMSVTGLIISLGLLIDNAIVVVEDYKLRRRKGADIGPAINQATSHLLVPLGASTATTVFAFMPIALAPGGVGDFTGTLGVSVALAVSSSFILAMTVVPAIAGFIDRRWPPGDGNRWWHNGFHSPALTARYRASVMTVLKRPAIGIGVACILPIIGFASMPSLTKQFFPSVDRDQFQVQLNLPAQASIFETRRAIERADAVLRQHSDIVDTFWSAGEGSPRVYYNAIGNADGVSSFAQGWITTTSPSATREMLPALQKQLINELPEAEVLALPFEQGPPVAAPVELRIVGPDLTKLRNLAEQMRRLLSEIDEVTYTRATLTSSEPKLVFVPSELAATQSGLRTGDLTRELNASLLGLSAGTLQEGNTEIGVRVRMANERRDDTSDLATLPVTSATGQSVPLDQLGRWELRPAASAIDRYQGERISTVQAFLVPFTLPATVLAQFEDKIAAAGIELPAGYRFEFGGEAEESAGASGNLVSMFLVFALAMATVVTLSLNSFRYAAMIFVVAALSFGLALFGVRLFSYPFGYMALVGGLGMIGIAINGAIIVLSALKANPIAVAGDLDETADVVVDATRHIVSTTVTTIGGFVPLIVDGGEFWPPLATAIAGGVVGSAIIALYMVPAVFRLTTRPALPRHSSKRRPTMDRSSECSKRRKLERLSRRSPAREPDRYCPAQPVPSGPAESPCAQHRL